MNDWFIYTLSAIVIVNFFLIWLWQRNQQKINKIVQKQIELILKEVEE